MTTSTTGTSVTVTFWGTKRYEVEALKGPRTRVRPFQKQYITREDCTPAAGHEGFDVVVTRVFRQGGSEVEAGALLDPLPARAQLHLRPAPGPGARLLTP